MLLKFCLFSFLSRNTLSRKHDVGILFTWTQTFLVKKTIYARLAITLVLEDTVFLLESNVRVLDSNVLVLVISVLETLLSTK